MTQNTFPEQDWKPWLFGSFSPLEDIWSDPSKFIIDFARENNLDVTLPDQWNHITSDQICNNGGSEMLKYYDNSLLKILQVI